MQFFSNRSADNTPLRLNFWLIALCCLPPILGVLSMASGMGWPTYLQGADIRAYYTGGAIVLHGEGARLYDLTTQWQWQRAAFPGLSKPADLLPFLAPPFVAAPMSLLARLSVRDAFLFCLSANWILLSLLTHRFVGLLSVFGRRAQIVTVVLCITCAPVFITLLQGQWALLLALALLSSWLDLRRARDFRGGLWLAVLLFKPQLLLLPLLILVWKKRARALAGFATGAFILLAISLFLIGIDGLKTYAQLLQTASNWNHQYGVVPEAMYTWRGFLRNFSSHVSSVQLNALWWLGVAPLFGILVWCWRGAWPLENATLKAAAAQEATAQAASAQAATSSTRCDENLAARFDALWAMTIFAALFCSPYLYYHDLTLLLVPVLMLALTARAMLSTSLKKLFLSLPIIGFALFWIEFFFIGHPLGTVAPNVFFMAICFAALAFSLLRLRDETAGAAPVR